ncbi:Zds2p [Saccharomyces cerevisiae YJM1418]|nr:Zds2p [Saccharomyces cerevisiae YJM1418]CAD6644064.1 HLJ1_G0017330.mRNA.1.CDS.1 [Saccharomyces cerevisiae]CAI4660508.1 BAI_1a_G0039030.mRNA.1.CDS.1 [Saccharomyces cerevisiae]CAI7254384.1 BAI_1a_G0039030.mRNA.1.CDS.1 [Saccharomyces cerevisiae]
MVLMEDVQNKDGHNTVENSSGGTDSNNNIQMRRMRKTQLSKKELFEKRKSDVLIAAKSLDTEIQNVKNLKRLSIGSMDLVIDPELEFKVNSRNSYSSDSSKESLQESLHEENIIRSEQKEEQGSEDNDAYEEGDATNVDDSIDITQTEYLHDEETLEKEKIIRNASSSTSSSARVTSRNRRLSGVKTLAHDVVLDVENDHDSKMVDLTQNLLWVPADQHPNVKPENYLELIQDTLQNIQISTNQDIDENKLELGNNHVISNRKRTGSVVRRPSRLKTSYTKFDDEPPLADKPQEGEIQVDKRISSSDIKTIRSVSLKEITEELTKISNNAGLTDSDAVTLARSLSMSGSFTNESLHLNGNHTENDNEFASNMFNETGLTIPERSSLRRSKFNTYKIRLEGSSLPQAVKLNSLMNIQTNDNRRSASSPASYTQVPQEQASLNDFHEIFDHYRRTSTDWSTENEKYVDSTNYYSDEEDLTHASISQESSLLSTDSSNNSVLIKPHNTGSMISEKLDQHVSSSEKSNTNNSEANHGWSWLNSSNGSLNANEQTYQQLTDDEDDEECVDNEKADFVNLSVSRRAKSTKRASERINHSKNRHSPIFQIHSEEAKSVVITPSVVSSSESQPSKPTAPAVVEKKVELPTDTQASTHKKNSLEKRLAKLFKRKQHNGTCKSDVKVIKKSVKKELKKKASHSSLSKFRKSPKKKPQEAEVNCERPSSPTKTITTEDIDTASVIEPEVRSSNASTLLPDSHTSHSSEFVVETISELDGDDSFDISGGDVNYDVEVHSSISRDTTAGLEEDIGAEREDNTSPTAPQISTLPPRKLTFEDVVKPDYPNAPIKFTDSAFGFPLPMITNSTVIMFDHRLGINVERAIYRLSHLKLSDPGRELRQQVLLSNFMYSYLNLVNHTLYMEQVGTGDIAFNGDSALGMMDKNDSDGTILIPDI